MFNLRNKKNSIYINLVSMFVLFFLFIILALFLIIFATDAYKNMKNQTEYTFNSTALIGYISNKIKSCDSEEYEVKIEKVKQASEKKDNRKKYMLVLENKKEEIMTYIYEKENKIYENVVKKGTEIKESEGQALFQAKSLELKKINDNLIKIKVNTLENESIERYVYITSKVLR